MNKLTRSILTLLELVILGVFLAEAQDPKIQRRTNIHSRKQGHSDIHIFVRYSRSTL
jgi:hypothetical protein